MAAPLTPISPFPELGFTLTLPNSATVVELDPQPYSNTKTITLLNLSETETIYVQAADLAETPAFARFVVRDAFPDGVPRVGDALTIGGFTLTGAAGPQAPGTDTYSCSTRAFSVVAVQLPVLPPGSTIQLVWLSTPLPVLTGTPGGGAPGTDTFDSSAGDATLIAASIISAINDPLNSYSGRYLAILVGGPVFNIVSRNPGSLFNYDPSPWPGVGPGENSITVSSGLAATQPAFGTDPDGFDPVYADNNSLASQTMTNIVAAINDPTNSWAINGVATAVQTIWGAVGLAGGTVLAIPPGTAGNGIPVSDNTGGTRLDFFGVATAQGKDAVPDAFDVTEENSSVIPPSSALTLCLGSEGNRQPLATSAFWAVNPGSKLGIVVKLGGGSNQDLNVTYTQNRGYDTGV